MASIHWDMYWVLLWRGGAACAGEVVPAMGRKVAAATFQAFHQGGPVHVLVIAPGQQLAPLFLGLGPALAALVKGHGSGGQGGASCAITPGQGWSSPMASAPMGVVTLGVRTACVHQLALDAGAKAQWCQADTRGRHDLQRIFGPVHHMETLRRVVQGRGLGRRVPVDCPGSGNRRILPPVIAKARISFPQTSPSVKQQISFG